ncbi:hypothetical protein ACIOYV_08155 [Pseudomonas sp. NPDC087342]|uniref:hypothetical protein n=1 Tax=Pseudomonas sp. NPDC087342 TaxID=3364437 RepID=UPI0037FC6808
MSTPKKPIDPQALEDSPSADMDAPQVPAVLDPSDPEGLLPIRALGRDLNVEFMGWDFTTVPNRIDRVELGFTPFGSTFVMVNERLYPSLITVPLPQTLTVPRGLLQGGVYEVSLRVSPSMVNPKESRRRKITIDLTKPNFGNMPDAVIFPLELNGTITEDYLNTHGQVIVEVPFYGDVTATDRALYYWTDKAIPPDTETPIREQEFSQQDIDNNFLAITVYADEIRAWPPGPCFMYYFLRDRAGNIGPRSRMSPITVDRTPLPGALLPPRVPLSPRGLIDRQHARDDVWVEIDPYDFPSSAQSIVVDWNATTLPDFPVDPAGFPLKIPVPWSTLHALGDGPLRALVSYRIRFPGLGPPSPSISVPVNLTVAGPDHPGAPALINDRLAKLEIRGQNSDIPNTLLGIDYGLPAKATLTLFDGPEPYDEIKVYWGRVVDAVDSYEVQFGDIAGKPLEFEIPWSAIDQDKSNPHVPVYYTTSNSVNLQESQRTEVDVSIVTIDDLKEPTFPHAGVQRVLHCCSVPRIWNGVTVRIPSHPAFETDDEVIVHWQGCRSENGSDPIDGTYAAIPRTLNDDDVNDGFDLVITDYETLIAPMVNRGSALVYYELFKKNGGIGTSPDNDVIINRTMPSGEICSPTHEVWCDADGAGADDSF